MATLSTTINKGNFKKGHIPWIKGKKHSLETREKMSEMAQKRPCLLPSKKGVKLTDEHKAKISKRNIELGRHPPSTKGVTWGGETRKKVSESRLGKKHWNWQGGKTSLNKRLRVSARYKEWRVSVFKRDNYTCQFCGERGGELHADHIKQFAFYPELRFEVSNGRTLCKPCHKMTDTYANNKRR